jgi:hypothetical protein
MIADELRRQADVFTDLAELQPKLSRDPERPTPREGSERLPSARAVARSALPPR